MQGRHQEPEIMDQPDLGRERLDSALGGLSRLNKWSGSAAKLWPVLRDLAMQSQRTESPNDPQPVTLGILDLATGAGDNPIRLALKARKENLSMYFAGCVVNPRSIEFASRRAQEAGTDVDWFVRDVLTDELPSGYDVVMCSLFLHHLADGDAVRLLAAMRRAARRQVLVSDLERSSAGYALTLLATKLLSRSVIVKTDGPRSVRAAFTLGEANQLARRADLKGCTVRRRWPFRYLLTWRRP